MTGAFAVVAAVALVAGCADGAAAAPPPSHPTSASAGEGTPYVAAPIATASTASAQPSADHSAHGAAAAEGAVFTCPMHPEVASDKPGQCPHCGMNLVPKK